MMFKDLLFELSNEYVSTMKFMVACAHQMNDMICVSPGWGICSFSAERRDWMNGLPAQMVPEDSCPIIDLRLSSSLVANTG